MPTGFDQTEEKLSRLAGYTLAGLIYIYFSKLIDTIYPGIFRPAALAGAVVGLNILAGLTQVLFFVALTRWNRINGQAGLVRAARLGLVGAVVGLAPKFLALALLLQPAWLQSWLLAHGRATAAWTPLIKAVCLTGFSLAFAASPARPRGDRLAGAFAAGLAGWSIMALVHSLVLLNLLTSGGLNRLTGLLGKGPLAYVLPATASLICLGWFHWVFVRLTPAAQTPRRKFQPPQQSSNPDKS